MTCFFSFPLSFHSFFLSFVHSSLHKVSQQKQAERENNLVFPLSVVLSSVISLSLFLFFLFLFFSGIEVGAGVRL